MPISSDVFDYTSSTAAGPSGATISSTKTNQRWDDVKNALNTTQSIARGGSGGTTAVQAADNLSTTSTDIASATTTDLSTATGVNVTITGTTTITGFGTLQEGAKRYLTFAAALTLTHNSTSLILPDAVNITTVAGDRAIVVSLGSGNWAMLNYQTAAGDDPLIQLQSAVATTSGTTVDQTSIPSGVRRVSIVLNGVSVSGSSNLQVLLGDSGGFETTGYVGLSISQSQSNGLTLSSGFVLTSNLSDSSSVFYGTVTLTLLDSTTNEWVCHSLLTDSGSSLDVFFTTGGITLDSALDRVRVTTENGTDTVDQGKLAYSWEF